MVSINGVQLECLGCECRPSHHVVFLDSSILGAPERMYWYIKWCCVAGEFVLVKHGEICSQQWLVHGLHACMLCSMMMCVCLYGIGGKKGKKYNDTYPHGWRKDNVRNIPFSAFIFEFFLIQILLLSPWPCIKRNIWTRHGGNKGLAWHWYSSFPAKYKKFIRNPCTYAVCNQDPWDGWVTEGWGQDREESLCHAFGRCYSWFLQSHGSTRILRCQAFDLVVSAPL